MDETMYFDMVYHKHDPKRWNEKKIVNPVMVSWYVRFMGV